MPRLLLAPLAALALFLSALPARAVTLVQDGKPLATIVISADAIAAKPYKPASGKSGTPAEKIRLAADELQRYIERISGAKIPIESAAQLHPDDPVLILVGPSPATDALHLKIPAGLTPDRKEEGFLIHAAGHTLVLAGNDAGPYQGTFYAVSEFLNRLGVRWFMPSDFGTYVPHLATIGVKDLDFHDAPDFIVRSWNGNLAPELRDAESLFRLHNKLTLDPSAIIAIPGDSSLRRYLPDKSLQASHPEYWAQKADGSLNPNMVSLSNPDVPRLVAEKIEAQIKKTREKNPEYNSLGIAPDDGMPMDLAKETMANNLGFTCLGGREGVVQELSISEEWFRFVNKVNAEVDKDFPGFIITTNGYANRTPPPEGVTLDPHMGVMFAAIWADLLHAYDDPKSWQQQVQGDMLKRWTQLCPRVFVYNYNFSMLVNALTPLPLTRKIARNTPLMKDWGVIGFQDEQTYPWMAHGITFFYLRAKLYWHAHDDAKAILDDYFDKWYGPAAKPSQAYWDAIEDCLESTPLLGHEDRILPYVYNDKLIAEMEKDQKEAESLAKDEPYATHVRVDRLILEHLKGYMAMNRAEFVGNYPEAIKQANYMFTQREALNKISPYFYIPEATDRRKYFTGSLYWNLTKRKANYQKLLDMTTGKTGDLVVQAPRRVKFALDDLDIGRYARWEDPAFDRSSWRLIDTATPFYLQDPAWLDKHGAPHTGYLWYVFDLDVPASKLGKPIHVYAPIVTTEAWVWTNGQFSGHRPYLEAYIRPAPLDFDVTPQLKAGKNVIAVRVSTSQSPVQAAEGFQGPLFLYAPHDSPPAAPK